MRQQWNQTVDRALVSGLSKEKIMEVKQKEIGEKIKTSIQQSGENPKLLKCLIVMAISVLELLIDKRVKENINEIKNIPNIDGYVLGESAKEIKDLLEIYNKI